MGRYKWSVQYWSNNSNTGGTRFFIKDESMKKFVNEFFSENSDSSVLIERLK